MNKIYKRDAYFLAKKALENNQMVVMFGLKRIGKTTILKQLEKAYSNSVYVDWNHFDNLLLSDADFYKELETKCSQYDLVLFDEVQERDKWDQMLVSLYNKFVANNKCNIVATGSSALIRRQKELGLDRTKRIYISSLSFSEYINFTKKAKNINNFEFFLGRGFPKYANYNFKKDGFENLLDEVLKPIFDEDILRQNPGKSYTNMLKVINYLGTKAFGEINESTIARETMINRKQINDYINIFDKAAIIRKVFKVDIRGKEPKKQKYKCYLNPHFYIWLNRLEFNQILKFKPHLAGYIIEAYWLHSQKFNTLSLSRYYYLKDLKNKNKEIDFVTLGYNNNPFNTINEIKYRNNTSISDVAFLHSVDADAKNIWVKDKINSEISFNQNSILDL